MNIDPMVVIELLDNCFFSKLSFSKFILLDPSLMWRKVIAFNDKLEPLARFVLGFITLGTSEADVERCVSIQRDMQMNKTRINFSTIKSRMKIFLHEQHNA